MSTLLFIHGFATGPAIWQGQIDELSKYFKVITAVERIDPGSDVFIIGWSMGGWKALDLLREQHLKIKGLILVSAFAKYIKSDDYLYGTPLALLRKLEKKFMTNYKEGLRYFYDLMFKDKKMLSSIDQLPIPEKNDIEKWFDKLRNEDKREFLPKINIPVLIVQGDQDPIVSPASALYLKERIRNSEMHIFPGAGHAPFFEEKEKFNSILKDFIRKHENG